MSLSTVSRPEYVLGSTNAEHRRLILQNRMISRITRHLLDEIHLVSGMRVLDIGAGVGDVALLMARIVGKKGEVLCVDVDGGALETARSRADSERLKNISFRTSDIHAYESDGEFDVVFGRCVLIHQTDPLLTLVSASKHARRGGIVAFQEPWFSRAFSHPSAPLFDKVIRWIHETVVEANRLDLDLPLRLPSIFLSAGLPAPKLRFEMVVDACHDLKIYQFIADTVGSLLPRMEQFGVASVVEVQLHTLAERLQMEAIALNTMIGMMPLMGAWCTKQ